MSQFSRGQKAVRAGILLCGLRDACVAEKVALFGLGDPQIQAGWDLFLRVTHLESDAVPPVDRTPQIVSALESFELRWFAVAREALVPRFPSCAEHLFRNLERPSDQHVAWTVAFFLQRLREMAEGAPPYGLDGPFAWQELRQRGLDVEELQRGDVLLERLQSLDRGEPVLGTTASEERRAEEALWTWYLRWSAVCRHVLSDEDDLLRVLGLHRPRQSPGAEPIELAADEDLTSPPPGMTPPPAAPWTPGTPGGIPQLAKNPSK